MDKPGVMTVRGGSGISADSVSTMRLKFSVLQAVKEN